MKPIYLDHHATTPVDPVVMDAMLPYFTGMFGNASSLDHSYGHDASTAVEHSRGVISKAIGARQDDIIFTSGATESNNLAIMGTMKKYRERGNHIITCTIEHDAVLDATRHLEKNGKVVTYLPVDEYGIVPPKDVEAAITDETVMVSIMSANNEIGTIQDINEIGRITRKHNVIFHTDAAQAVGHIPINVDDMNIDLMSFSAHKMYGPKGVGALYIRGAKPRVKPDPIIRGGGQERNLCSGTLNVPGIVGFAKAVELAVHSMEIENERFKAWTDIMLESFQEVGGVLNGHPTERLAHNLNVYFSGVESKALINSVSREIAISAGSACTTNDVEASHVLLALGHGEERAHSSIRTGLGRFNTEEEVRRSTEIISSAVRSLRELNPGSPYNKTTPAGGS